MALFDRLRGWASGADRRAEAADRVRLAEAWGLDDTSHPEFPGRAPAADPAAMAAPPATSGYDVTQWRRKLARILDHLPASESEWDDCLADARALGLADDWVRRAQVEEFTLVVRRAVADGRFSPQEHRQLELARTLIGLTEVEADALVNGVVDEAESIFGKAVEGTKRPAED